MVEQGTCLVRIYHTARAVYGLPARTVHTSLIAIKLGHLVGWVKRSLQETVCLPEKPCQTTMS